MYLAAHKLFLLKSCYEECLSCVITILVVCISAPLAIKSAPGTVPSEVILSKNTPLCKQSNHFFLHGLFCYKNEKNEYINRHGILNEKYYLVDHGLREAAYGGNMRDINLVLENIVYMEMLRRGYTVTVGKYGNREIDFVGDKRGDKLYVQVTYLLAAEETIAREFGVFDSIRDNYPKYVVSMDEFDFGLKLEVESLIFFSKAGYF